MWDDAFVDLIDFQHISVLRDGLDHPELLEPYGDKLPTDYTQFLMQQFQSDEDVLDLLRES